MSILTKYRLIENKSILSFIAHSISNNTTSMMVTDLHDVSLEKRQWKCFQHINDPPELFSKNSSWKAQKISPKKNPNFYPQIFQIIELSKSLLIHKRQNSIS